MNTKARNVDEYILNQPQEVRAQLEELRTLVQTVIPAAEEIISYGMPAYKHYGIVVYWGAFKNHFSLFGGTGTFTAQFKKELKDYVISKGTVQFPYGKKLPKKLIKDIVKFRVKENEAKRKK